MCHTENDKMLPPCMICTSQNWHLCSCDMHQHQATSTFWTFVSSSLGGWVPAAELVTLWRSRNQREADLRKSAASWNPLWMPVEMVPALQLITKSIIYQRWQGRLTKKKNTRDAGSHTDTQTHSELCSSCSDRVVIPVSGQKIRFCV